MEMKSFRIRDRLEFFPAGVDGGGGFELFHFCRDLLVVGELRGETAQATKIDFVKNLIGFSRLFVGSQPLQPPRPLLCVKTGDKVRQGAMLGSLGRTLHPSHRQRKEEPIRVRLRR